MYTVIPTARFEKDIKYYIKKKRYFHIGEDIRQITNELQQGHLIWNGNSRIKNFGSRTYF